MLEPELFLGASNTNANAPTRWSFKSLSPLPRFSAVIFGEDVAFGGVFRCTVGLRDKYGMIIIIILSILKFKNWSSTNFSLWVTRFCR